MNASLLHVRPACATEEQRFQDLMQAHHYLGALVKIGNTIRYVAEREGRWVGLLSISASALKCAARDQWIGWGYRHQYDRLNLVANNSRFLILPGCHDKNLASQILSMLRRRVQRDWVERFGYPLLMLETFVDPERFHGTICRASNWRLVGHSPADFIQTGQGEHGRIETRKIWTTTALNDYLDFPHVRQAFMIERESINKKSGEQSQERIYGITSAPVEKASAEQVLRDNRGHWCVESCHYIIDWNYDEDRSRIRTGHGPENISRLRRFAIGLLKGKKTDESIPEKMKKLLLNTRAVFDILKMTRNAMPRNGNFAGA
ncbi:MAG: ISAs1 family transposase [Candidatus Sedimenticola endophacoides]